MKGFKMKEEVKNLILEILSKEVQQLEVSKTVVIKISKIIQTKLSQT